MAKDKEQKALKAIEKAVRKAADKGVTKTAIDEAIEAGFQNAVEEITVAPEAVSAAPPEKKPLRAKTPIAKKATKKVIKK
jgi:hypothetical protein